MPIYTLPPTTVGAAYGRSTPLLYPNAYDPSYPLPLITLCHSYGASRSDILSRFVLTEAHNFHRGCLIFAPDGVNDGLTSNKWFDYRDITAPAVKFFPDTIAEIKAHWNVDPKRSYGIGYSCGGFMIHRLAANFPELFTAIWTLSGSRIAGEATPATHIAATVVHGDGDTTVLTAGDATGATLPGSMGGTNYVSHAATAAAYAAQNGGGALGAAGSGGPAYDLVTAVVGSETTRALYAGLRKADRVEKQVIVGGNHSFSLSGRGGENIFVQLERYHRGV